MKLRQGKSLGVRLFVICWRHRFIVVLVLAALVLTLSSLRPRGEEAAGFSPIEHVFSIRAQPMATALNEFSEQARLQMLYDADVVSGVGATSVEGRYSSNEALRKLLLGTGLSYRLTGRDTVTIVKDKDGKPYRH